MSWNNFHRWDKNRPIFFNLGMVISLSIVNIAINYEGLRPVYDGTYSVEQMLDFNITSISEYADQKPDKPLVRVKKPDPLIARIEPTENAVTDEANLMPANAFSDVSANTVPFISTPPPVLVPEPPLPATPVSPYEHFAEVMPCLSECNTTDDEEERRSCTKTAMLKFIYKHLKYPVLAAETGVEGTVVISFVISKDGMITDIQAIRDIGVGCGAAAVKTISSLSGWIPGRQNKRPVNVKYTIPIRFKLNQ